MSDVDGEGFRMPLLERSTRFMAVLLYWLRILAGLYSLTLFYFGLIVFNYYTLKPVHLLGGVLAILALFLYRMFYFPWLLEEIEKGQP